MASRREQLRKLQEEVIELEDLKAGVSITDLGLNDFRMDLVNYVKANEGLEHLPNGMHAVVPADVDKGLLPGAIFALRNRNQQANANQQNRLHPYYLVYVGKDGQVMANPASAKRILDLARTACKDRSSPIPECFQQFNKDTRDGKDMSRYSSLLQSGVESMISVKQEKDVDSLFSGGRTSAMTDVIAGLSDFELIAFIVIQEAK